MPVQAVVVEGGLFPPDLLERVRGADAAGQRATDFGLNGARRLPDEIQAAFSDVRSIWDAFERRRARSRESLTTLTREAWIIPFLEVLGYRDFEVQRSAIDAGGERFVISHRLGHAEDAAPLHVVAADRGLDERDGRRSPHSTVQEFLNRSDAVWGIVTNGETLRLLRESERFTRPSYVELDLKGIIDGNQYSEFALLYRLLHSSRMPVRNVAPQDCWLERYYDQGIQEGGRVREKLRTGVEEALLILGGALLKHPESEPLRESLARGHLDAQGCCSARAAVPPGVAGSQSFASWPPSVRPDAPRRRRSLSIASLPAWQGRGSRAPMPRHLLSPTTARMRHSRLAT
jgi:hypothetical protein